MPRFSIIVPVYNTEEYLSECIESVLKQSYSDYELILVDDGSTDECPEICESYAEKYRQIKVIHKPNSGVADARNCGFYAAIGDYVLFMDADDFFNEECLKKIDEHIGKYGEVDVSLASMLYYDQNKDSYFDEYAEYPCERIKEKDGGEVFVRSIKNNTILWSASASIFKREMLKNNGILFTSGLTGAEDLDYFTRVMIKAKSFSSSNIKICSYRIARKNSVSTNLNLNVYCCKIRIFKEWFDYFLNSSLTLEQKKVLCGFFSRCFTMQITDLMRIDKKDRDRGLKCIAEVLYIVHYKYQLRKRYKAISGIIKIFGIRYGIYIIDTYHRLRKYSFKDKK